MAGRSVPKLRPHPCETLPAELGTPRTGRLVRDTGRGAHARRGRHSGQRDRDRHVAPGRCGQGECSSRTPVTVPTSSGKSRPSTTVADAGSRLGGPKSERRAPRRRAGRPAAVLVEGSARLPVGALAAHQRHQVGIGEVGTGPHRGPGASRAGRCRRRTPACCCSRRITGARPGGRHSGGPARRAARGPLPQHAGTTTVA
jgi:hypothetical protein